MDYGKKEFLELLHLERKRQSLDDFELGESYLTKSGIKMTVKANIKVCEKNGDKTVIPYRKFVRSWDGRRICFASIIGLLFINSSRLSRIEKAANYIQSQIIRNNSSLRHHLIHKAGVSRMCVPFNYLRVFILAMRQVIAEIESAGALIISIDNLLRGIETWNLKERCDPLVERNKNKIVTALGSGPGISGMDEITKILLKATQSPMVSIATVDEIRDHPNYGIIQSAISDIRGAMKLLEDSTFDSPDKE